MIDRNDPSLEEKTAEHIAISYTLRAAWMHPLLRCFCGHVLNGFDLDLHDNHVRVICAHCGHELLAFSFVKQAWARKE